jgi:hypothetical protein
MVVQTYGEITWYRYKIGGGGISIRGKWKKAGEKFPTLLFLKKETVGIRSSLLTTLLHPVRIKELSWP